METGKVADLHMWPSPFTVTVYSVHRTLCLTVGLCIYELRGCVIETVGLRVVATPNLLKYA